MKVLSGIRIAITRPASQSVELAEPLEQAGAVVHVCPLIRVEGVVDGRVRQRVVSALPRYDWLVFTSVNGVQQFMELLRAGGAEQGQLRHARVACVGPATAAAARRAGFDVTVMPADHLGAELPAALAAFGSLAGQNVLIARAAGGGTDLPSGLRARGAHVDDLELYRSVPDVEGAARLASLVEDNGIDLLTFTSGSAVTYFVDKIGNPTNMAVAVIGPSTAQVARSFGLRVDIEADPHTAAGMIKAILDYYAAAGGNRRSDAGK